MYDLSYEIEHLVIDDESHSNNTVITLDNVFYCISDYLGICDLEHWTWYLLYAIECRISKQFAVVFKHKRRVEYQNIP